MLGERAVLGLATGSGPIKVYGELVRLHREEGLSFGNVATFNLDEYYPMTQQSTKSYHYFMHHHLFDHIDIISENIYIPIGTHLNWRSSHIVNDFYQRFVKPDAGEKELVRMGRNRQWF